jgi:DNA-binding transcriptional LysR family regulator
MLDEFDMSLFSVNELGRHQSVLVTIACIPTAAFYFLPRVIKRFNDQYPQIRFRILDLSANDCIESVARGEVEFGINIMASSDPNLEFTPLLTDPFVLACRRDHSLAQEGPISWSQLEGHKLITVARSSGNRALLDAALARSDLTLQWLYEVTHLSTSLGLVEAGLGASVLPRMATPQGEHPILMTRKLVEPEISRSIGVVRRRQSRLSPAADHFLEMLLGEWR